MKPWCAEGEVPIAANLNLYRGRKSRVGWQSDGEPLFGACGEAKLFKWKGKSRRDGDASSCWHDRGDLLVMDGQWQDEFLYCTDPGQGQERINFTFRWI